MTDSSPLDPDLVTDRESFFAFVEALAGDRRMSVAAEQVFPRSPYGSGSRGWENGTIESFLEAALAWAKASGNVPAEPSWRAFATFLRCGKIYE